MVEAGNTTATCLGFELNLKPYPRMVSRIRRLVEREFTEGGGDPEAVFRLAMVTHELLENAVKYSNGADVRLEVQLDPTRGDMRARMTNATSAEHRQRLRARVDLLKGAARPAEIYQDLMRRPAETEGESGLGLARIVSEGGLDLNLEDHEHAVTIEARSVPFGSPVHG
jgi:two-component sensor histidine kinase